MEKYPTFEEYENLYKRFFKRSTEEFISWSGIDIEGKSFLDLCGGGGRLSFYAHSKNCSVTYVDQEKDMIPYSLFQEKGIKNIHNMPVEDFLLRNMETYDVTVCQQAINYWLPDLYKNGNMKCLSRASNVFIFNTFNQSPGTEPVVKEYFVDDVGYVETSFMIDNIIYHVQSKEGHASHYTKFYWITSEEYKDILSEGFKNIEEKTQGSSSLWICKN